MKPRILIPWFPGTNCHEELAHAFSMVGGDPRIVPIRRLLDGRDKLTDCDLLALAGGFSYGDHGRSGIIAAFDLTWHHGDKLRELKSRGTPIIGICNGFQILVEAGLLSGKKRGEAILDQNECGHFQHWATTRLVIHDTGSLWTRGLEGQVVSYPVAHGEGRLVTDGSANLKVVLTYGTSEGTTEFPASPNGCPIAGICSSNGAVIGMMPHPERRVCQLHGGDEGLLILRNGVQAVR